MAFLFNQAFGMFLSIKDDNKLFFTEDPLEAEDFLDRDLEFIQNIIRVINREIYTTNVTIPQFTIIEAETFIETYLFKPLKELKNRKEKIEEEIKMIELLLVEKFNREPE